MKKTLPLCLVLFVSLFLSSCKKEDQKFVQFLKGNWSVTSLTDIDGDPLDFNGCTYIVTFLDCDTKGTNEYCNGFTKETCPTLGGTNIDTRNFTFFAGDRTTLIISGGEFPAIWNVVTSEDDALVLTNSEQPLQKLTLAKQ